MTSEDVKLLTGLCSACTHSPKRDIKKIKTKILTLTLSNKSQDRIMKQLGTTCCLPNSRSTVISWKQDLTEQAPAPVPEPVPEPVKWSMTKKFGGQNLNFDRQLLEFGAKFFGGLIFVISLAKYPHFNI